MWKFPNTFPAYLQPISMHTLLTWSINKELQVDALLKWPEASREEEGTQGEQEKEGKGVTYRGVDSLTCLIYAGYLLAVATTGLEATLSTAGRAGVAASSDADADVNVVDSIIHNTKGDYTNGDWLCALRVEPASYLTVAQLCLTVDHQPSLSSLETTVTKLRRCPAPAAVRLRRAQIFFGYFEANYL